MPETYLDWCEKVKYCHPHLDGVWLNGVIADNANSIKRVKLGDGSFVVVKQIAPERPYIPRIKAMGEVAYALLDYHLSQAGRVTPNVYAQNQTTIWRSYLRGRTGEDWRGDLYAGYVDLKRTDEEIAKIILESPSAERIALLDMIFLCQDRSGRNWLFDEAHFWALDNSMLWPYKGFFGDKRTIKTGKVDHLQHPMKALLFYNDETEFRSGVFSSVYAGRPLREALAHALATIDWKQYFFELGRLICAPLVYGYELIDDWRFLQLQQRSAWILDKGRFVSIDDLDEWQALIDKPPYSQDIWTREWETANLETQ